MKKTLAIFLALLAAASVTLASCGNKKKPLEQGGGGSYIDDEYDDDTTTNNDGNSNTGDTGNNGNTNVSDPTANYTDTNDVVYAGVELNLRTTPSTNGTVIKTVPFGTKLNRSQTNGDWDKITIEGDSNVYYVLHEWTTASNANFTFTDCEHTAFTVVGAKEGKGVQFYYSPFVHNNLSTALNNAYLGTAFLASDLQNYTLTRVAMNSSWVKVIFTGTVKGKTLTDEVFYIQASHFNDKDRISDPTFPGQGGSNNPGTGIG